MKIAVQLKKKVVLHCTVTYNGVPFGRQDVRSDGTQDFCQSNKLHNKPDNSLTAEDSYQR